MINKFEIKQDCVQNTCTILLTVPESVKVGKEERPVNIKNCDIFVGESCFVIYVDVKLKWLCTAKKIIVDNVKELNILYDSKSRTFQFCLPCESTEETMSTNGTHLSLGQHTDLWKLKRITDLCRIYKDGCLESFELESNFNYGFAFSFKGPNQDTESDLNNVCRMPEPNLYSPFHRSVLREIDELKDFDRDQFKANFLCIDVPEGHDNPMDVEINWVEDLNESDTSILQSLLFDVENCSSQRQSEVDCGLISLLLAVAYDVRTTSNDPTSESGWTRSILTPILYYFEEFTNINDVVIAFMRRCLIYPLYRNYDLSRLCVKDVVAALNCGSRCIAKQLIVTKELFDNGHINRKVFNRFYIDKYIAYVCSDTLCSQSHMRTLSNNLKNVLYDVSKNDLRMELAAIESEVFKEIISDSALESHANKEEDGDITESDDYDSESSSQSATDENSVIEECI